MNQGERLSSRVSWIAPLAVVIAVLGTAGPAFGASASVFSDGTNIVAKYQAGGGEVNHVTATASSGAVTFTDSGISMSAGAGCTTSGTSTIVCRHDGGIEKIQMVLGEEADWAKNDTSLPSGITAGQLPSDLGDTVYGGTARDFVYGHAGNDKLYGNAGNDELRGGGGNDTIYGQGNNDELVGDEAGSPQASNSVYGGSGNDTVKASDYLGQGFSQTLSGGTGNDFIYGAGGADTLTGGDGIDLLDPSEDNKADSVSGGADKDVVDYLSNNSNWRVRVTLDNLANDGPIDLTKNDNVKSDIETVWGSPFNDELTGTVGPQTLDGYGGNDTLDGKSGADVLIGNGGTDTASYANHTAGVTVTINGTANDGVPGENDNVQTSVENVTGSEDNDTLTGSSGVNTLAGGNGADTLNGLGNDDVLAGGGSNDKFIAGAGADDMFGGDGIDTGDYSARIVPETITLDDQPNDGSAGENDNLRAEQVFGGSNDDDITGDDQGNFLEGRGGDDTLTGLGNVDYLAGGDEADSIFGGDGDDVITNGASPDGADSVNGGPGTGDLSTYGDRTSSLTVSLDNVADDGEAGENDNVHANVERVFGGSAPDGLQGSSADNLFAGGGGADTVAGAAGNDTLKGDGGTDSLFGGDDNDSLAGGPGADPLAGGPGYDTADYSSAGANIDVSIDDVADDGVAAEGDNVMTTIEAVLGGRFNDKIEGDSDPNTLAGGLGADIIRGFDGADIVAGGNGVDTLRGGNGNDELHAVDSTQDDLVCGPNIDAYAADNIDTVDADCENALP